MTWPWPGGHGPGRRSGRMSTGTGAAMNTHGATARTIPVHADGLPTPRRYYAAVAIWLAISMSVLDSAIANIALPTIARELHAAPPVAVWIVNAYQLAITVLLLPLAAMGDRIGHARSLSPRARHLHRRIARLRARAQPDRPDRRAHVPGDRRCRHHEHECRIGARHLSVEDARARHGLTMRWSSRCRRRSDRLWPRRS